MDGRSLGARAVVAGLVGFALLTGAVPAHAVLSGENGRIVFISGRAPETDATARPYLLTVPSNSTGGGTLSGPISPPGGQYRHPTWSPDRTKIAYANGTAGIYDIFVQDIAAGTGPVQITPTEGAGANNLSADRPAWSPDGTRIAYEHQPSAGSADRHIRVQPADDLQLPIPTTDLTTAGGPFEGKPAWTPDSATVYFHRGDPNTATNSDLYRKPATGGTETLAISDSSISEAQPSISPDGTQICYTLTNGGFNSTADVVVATLNPNGTAPGGIIVSKEPGGGNPPEGDYNCTWSPDGQMIAFVSGIFGTGRLVMVRADNTSPLEIPLADAPNFDGNPDWAPDGRPDCPDLTIDTTPGQPVTFSVDCNDTGPAYEQSNVLEYADSQPTNGTLEQEVAGEPFTYTPNQGFTGTDSFQVNSFDALGFGTDRGTIELDVRAPDDGPDGTPDPTATCRGKPATVVGTSGKDTLTGTGGADVIVGDEGKDKIRGKGSADTICGGAGNDKLKGNAGKDRLLGEAGRDRLAGGSGPDRLKGGGGRDRCGGGGGRDRGSGCERSAGIP
jgi:Tol biopolymer transport system component